ncbi:MAG: ATP-binding cassette domain-containing protein [Bacteroidales bacterium]|nr:ATP-binding cassette domain-containing protein [Bacteroidales bacterium]
MIESAAINLEKIKVFQGDFEVLSDVNFSLNKGEFVYLVGKVGSGKTSLIKTLNAELPLKEGIGNVVGFSLRKIKTREIQRLRRKIGVVFQDFQLLTDRTVFDNLNFVLRATGWKNKKEITERIKDVLERVGLSDKIAKMPHELSGGEQQRVVIARALLNNPELILADEPTGNLDPEAAIGILELLFDICANGRAVLMATHNHSLLKKFPAKTFKCENGKLSELKEDIQVIDFSELE